MPRLQVELSMDVYSQLKQEAFDRGLKFPDYIEQKLIGKERVDKRNPEVQRVIEAFEQAIGKMPRPGMQRRAASTLVKRYTVDRALNAIGYYATNRSDRFCPTISNLEELRDKWNQLETYAQKNARQSTVGVII